MNDVKRIKAIINFKLVVQGLVLAVFILVFAFSIQNILKAITIRTIFQTVFSGILISFTLLSMLKYLKLVKFINTSKDFQKEVARQRNKRECAMVLKDGNYYIDNVLLGNQDIDRISNLFFRPKDYYKYVYTIVDINKHPMIIGKRIKKDD